MNLAFKKFLTELKNSSALQNKRMHSMIENTLSMRQIGNKTHGDLAEVALTEYINNLVNNYSAVHTGKEKFRAKESEEDISVTEISTNETILISIKAYGNGPLQLSTDKNSLMFPHLTTTIGEENTADIKEIKEILESDCFNNFNENNILSFIYDEKNMTYKILIFDLRKAYDSVTNIKYEDAATDAAKKAKHGKKGKNRKHPIYKFYDSHGGYIFEVRYGAANANALQRGFWTHTKNAHSYFEVILESTYTINKTIVELIPKILNLHDDELKKVIKLLPL